jgi:hypothetical protein
MAKVSASRTTGYVTTFDVDSDSEWLEDQQLTYSILLLTTCISGNKNRKWQSFR